MGSNATRAHHDAGFDSCEGWGKGGRVAAYADGHRGVEGVGGQPGGAQQRLDLDDVGAVLVPNVDPPLALL